MDICCSGFQFERLYVLCISCVTWQLGNVLTSIFGHLFIWRISLVFLQVCFVNNNSGSPSVYSFCDSIICKSYMKIAYPDEAFFVSISMKMDLWTTFFGHRQWCYMLNYLCFLFILPSVLTHPKRWIQCSS